jgi:hypothetical protein
MCAPFLDWIAHWADAVKLARSGATVEAADLALRATAALDAFGEPYTAARLLVDLLPFLDEERQRAIADETANRLESMGALASALQARAASGSRSAA